MDNNEFDFLKSQINDDIPLPASLQPDAIEELLKNSAGSVKKAEARERLDAKKREKSGKPKRHIVRKVLAAAAVFVLVIFGSAAAYTYGGNAIRAASTRRVVSHKLKEYDGSEAAAAVLGRYRDEYLSSNESSIFEILGVPFYMRKAYETAAPETTGTAAGAVAYGDAAAGEANGGSFSRTNLQVEGVDEGDIVKNDGRYLYVFSDRIIISDVSDPKDMKVVSEISLPEKHKNHLDRKELYLTGRTLTAVYTFTDYTTYEKTDAAESAVSEDSFDHLTVIRIYDVSDVSAPVEKHCERISGSLVSSRITGGKLLTVVNHEPRYYTYDVDFEEECDRILQTAIPCVSVDGGEFTPIEDSKMAVGEDGKEFTVMTLTDITGQTEPDTMAELGASWDIYVTDAHLYLLSSLYSDKEETNITTIRRYDHTSGRLAFTGEASAEGVMLDRFSADEYDGYFRLALTVRESRYDMWYHYSTVTVFDSDLKQVGFVDDIGRDEDIYAVRFMGKTAYVVTFRNTDPLFVIDLSDPAAPVIKGEVKLPGFSEYLHPFGGGLLVGAGVKDGGDGGKLVLFDVSDPEHPKVLSEYISHKFFTTDPHAFTVIDENTFAIVQENMYGIPVGVLVVDIENGRLAAKGAFRTAVLREAAPVYEVYDDAPDVYGDMWESYDVYSDSYDYTDGYWGGYSYGTSGQSPYASEMRAAFTGSTLFNVTDKCVTAYDFSDDQTPLGVLKFE